MTVIVAGENFKDAVMTARQHTTSHMSYTVMQTRKAIRFDGYGVLPGGGFVVIRAEDVPAFQARYSSIPVHNQVAI
jgi:hypothetical protein